MFSDIDFSERRFAESQVLSITGLTSDQLAIWNTEGVLGPLGHRPDWYSAGEIVLLALIADVCREGLEFAAALAVARECEGLVRDSMGHFSRRYDENYPYLLRIAKGTWRIEHSPAITKRRDRPVVRKGRGQTIIDLRMLSLAIFGEILRELVFSKMQSEGPQ